MYNLIKAHKLNDDNKKYSYVRRDFNVILCFLFMIFVLLAFFSVIYAIKRLCRKGVTKYARTQFVVKHIMYVIVMIISW